MKTTNKTTQNISAQDISEAIMAARDAVRLSRMARMRLLDLTETEGESESEVGLVEDALQER